jgi:hypothetical protein
MKTTKKEKEVQTSTSMAPQYGATGTDGI